MSIKTCVKSVNATRDRKCGEPADHTDVHGRDLCSEHFDAWQTKLRQSRKAIRICIESYDLAGLDKLLHLLVTDTGTAMDVALAIHDSQKLLSKLKEVLHK